MNKVFKRLLSVLLALVMVIGMIPFNNLTIVQAGITGTIYFDNSVSNWGSVYVCTGGESFHTMSKDSSTGYYKLNVDNWGDDTQIIFTWSQNWKDIDGSDWKRSQQVSLSSVINKLSKATAGTETVNSKKVYSVTVSDYPGSGSGGGTTDTPSTDTKTIYLNTTNYMPTSDTIGWTKAYIYMWTNGVDGSGKTVEMTEINDGVFSYAVPSNYDRIIFKPNQNNWTLKTNDQTIPSDKDLFTCTSFGSVTSGVWGTYGVVENNNFPSKVTGKVTFFDLYTDSEIQNGTEYYGLQNWTYRVYTEGANYYEESASNNRSFTSIGRAFSKNVNVAISNYWKGTTVSPLYFGNFQPFYKIEPQTTYDGNAVYTVDPWWIYSNSFKYDPDNNVDTQNDKFDRDGYMNAVNTLTNFSWYLNRSIDIGSDTTTAKYGAVSKGIVGNSLVNGNIVASGTETVLPQFNSAFYAANPTIGKMYPTMDFPFAIRAINGAYYYQFDSGVGNSSNHDTVRMNEAGTALTYYNDAAHVVKGIMSDGTTSPGFFPFNDPEDSNGTAYNGSGNKLNYGFGMKLEIEFTMDEDGKVYAINGKDRVPAVFEFSGDDDVWIYVDGNLVLDMGGDHGVAEGKLDFSTEGNYGTATVKYVKQVDEQTGLSGALSAEKNYGNTADFINQVSKRVKIKEDDSTKFAFDKTDSEKIHTLTIFYEERGMFESNFKATFNLEQPTVLKTTNTVDVSGVNPALQAATKTVADKVDFTYEINDENSKDVTGKKYTKYTTESETSTAFDGTMTLKDGESATFTKQFDRAAILELIQKEDTRYNTLWNMYELKDDGIGSLIAASYQTDRDKLTTSDSRVNSKKTSAFKLENKDNGADQSVPAKVQIDYVQEPKTGGIAVMKLLEDGLETTDLFEFTVYLSDIFDGGSEEATYNLTYDVYNFNGESSTIARKGAIATGGVISLKANQFAIINGIPEGTNYRIVENEKVGYAVAGLDVSTNLNNDTGVKGDVATGTVTGTVVADPEANVDMFVYTNGEATSKDSFLVEVGKENTLNVIPTVANDGTLSETLAEINKNWTDSDAKKGFVFIVNGEPYVDGEEKPITTLNIDGVEYTVVTKDANENTIDPVIKVTPSADAVGSKDKITLKYRLVELDTNGAVKYNEKTDPDDETKTIKELAAITPVITMTNYLYKANEDVYVLDYGLDVDLAEKSGSGLFENDKLANKSLTGTTSTYWSTAVGKNTLTATTDTTAKQDTTAVTGTYGTITPTGDSTKGFVIDAVTTDSDGKETIHNPKITYSLNKFLNAVDNFSYSVMIQKGDADTDAGQTSNRFRLNVTSNISIYPANVVYYEDNFNSATTKKDSTVKIVYSGTVETEGTEYDLTQSNDQSEQYGYDDAYASGTTDSAGSSTALTANGYSTTAKFTFTGTGFDVVARTTTKSASIVYTVEKYDASTVTDDHDGFDYFKSGVVDTYYANGDLYQIPVIHEEFSGDAATYRVTLGIKASANENAVVYLDGIRIYNPLGTDGDSAYIDQEEGASFVKVSDLILGSGTITETGNSVNGVTGQVIEGAQAALLYNDYKDCGDDDYCDHENCVTLKGFSALGYTRTEDTNGKDGESSKTTSILQYMHSGPNNEIYLDDTASLAFVVETEIKAGETKTPMIQIEAKLANIDGTTKADPESDGVDLKVWNGSSLEKVAEVKSSTAMYYPIDLSKCAVISKNETTDEDGNVTKTVNRYLVVISGNTDQETETGTSVLSFSNLKYKDCTLSNPLNETLSIIDTSGLTGASSFVEFNGPNSVTKNSWITNKYEIVLNKNVFGDADPTFKMYYVNNGAKKAITVTVMSETTEQVDVEDGKTETRYVYKLKFKSPNAVGTFPIEIHYVNSAGESTEYFATSMTVKR